MHVGDMIRFGQSTRWFILNGPDELQAEETEGEHKKITILSKKQNQEFIFKKRVNQIRKMDEQLRQLKQERVQKLTGNAEEGVSWGMDFEEEEQIQQYQKQMEDNDEEDNESHSGDSSSSEDDHKLLDIEQLKQRDDLTEKQQ